MNRFRVLHRVLACALPLLLHAGCAGYQLGSVKPSRFADIETIAVPTFKNDTLEPRSAVMITNAVIKRLQEDGTYRIGTAANSDAILKGTFKYMDRRQLRASKVDQLQTRELGVTLRIRYEFVDRRTGEILDRGSVSGDTDIFLDPNFQLSERQAIPIAADEAAGKLASRLGEGW